MTFTLVGQMTCEPAFAPSEKGKGCAKQKPQKIPTRQAVCVVLGEGGEDRIFQGVYCYPAPLNFCFVSVMQLSS